LARNDEGRQLYAAAAIRGRPTNPVASSNRSTAVRAILIDHANHAARVAEGEPFLAVFEFKFQTAVFPERNFAISPRIAREFCREIPCPPIRGRRECRAPDAPAAARGV
jgi:hypothetical protein